MLKGNDYGAKEGKITVCTKPELRVVWIKFFLCAHDIIRNEKKHSFGVCMACSRTTVCTHRIAPQKSWYQPDSKLFCLIFLVFFVCLLAAHF